MIGPVKTVEKMQSFAVDPAQSVVCGAMCDSFFDLRRQTDRDNVRPDDILLFFFDQHFYFPAQLVGGFTLSDLLDKSLSQVSSLFPPGTCLQFLSRIGFSIPAARRFSSNVANSRSRAFRYM